MYRGLRVADKILVTGGAGYIGSHTVLALLEAGYNVLVLDNLRNSSVESLARIKQICGKVPSFVEGDIRDSSLLDELFDKYTISAVMHFAGLKSVAESVRQPLLYYENNVNGSLVLFQAMARAGIHKLVFSSSATVYGEQEKMPIQEDFSTRGPANPYGHSKLVIEGVLSNLAVSDPRWHIAVLRYFNPAGAHVSGLIGEHPNGIPNNLVPYICQVAIGKQSELSVYGDDYPTRDGTGVRDYIHVVDLAIGHINALQFINGRKGLNIWNLGSGMGYSVLEMVRAFEEVSGISIPYNIAPRRDGDCAECWADIGKAGRELNWRATRGLRDMMRDAWNWQTNNPDGYIRTS